MPTSLPEPPAQERAVTLRLVLARAFDLTRRRFAFFLALTIVANLPVYAAYLVFGNPFDAGPLEDLPTLVVEIVVAVLVGPLVTSLIVLPTVTGALFGIATLLSSYLALAATAHAVVREDRGHAGTLSDALSAALGRAPVLIGVGVCADAIRILATPFLVVPGILVLCVLSVALQACIVEGLGVRASLMRSIALTRGSWRTVLGVNLLAVPFAGMAEFVAMLVPDLDATSMLALRMVVGTIAATLVIILFSALYACLRAQEGPSDRVARVFA